MWLIYAAKFFFKAQFAVSPSTKLDSKFADLVFERAVQLARVAYDPWRAIQSWAQWSQRIRGVGVALLELTASAFSFWVETPLLSME